MEGPGKGNDKWRTTGVMKVVIKHFIDRYAVGQKINYENIFKHEFMNP